MFKSLGKLLFGSVNDRIIKSYGKKIEQINALEPKYVAMTDSELKSQTNELKILLKEKGKTLDEILPDAFAIVREAARRTLGERHYDVQLMGGIALHDGMISEMKTGEGKTLVSTLAAYLNALTEKGVHIVTVNDYLATRDSSWMGQIFNFLGLSVGCIKQGMMDSERRQAYASDITYGTNNEFGFDYLRDNMKYSSEELVRRPENYAIIDEIDSILIDEARTPLIISGPTEDNSDLYLIVNKIIPKLENAHFTIDEKSRNVVLTEEGTHEIENLLKKSNLLTENSHLYDMENISLIHHVNQALKAHKIFKKDIDYLIKDDQVMIIDEFTGRVMEGRRYSEGLHQALEAKENVRIQNENQTLASITLQNLFRLYPKLSGMSGTAATEAAELRDIYSLDVVEIPTHKTISRIDEEDSIYATTAEKYDAIIEQVKDCFNRKQPILVGTVSIEKSELLSKLLKQHKIPHNVLNAKNHEKEAQIIAQAGRVGAVTIATNMAGRGTDIKLGGSAEMALQQFANSHGLSKEEIPTEKNAEILQEIQSNKEEALKNGGLFVLGTERHESRRIDNQLRGRSGRQGDPGKTKFYLSLEDDLMRIFASEKMASILQKLGLKDGESIEHPMISRSLEKAQQKVEARNYEIRKNLLKFDDVMNDQRKVIFEQRRDLMQSHDISDIVKDIWKEINESIVLNHIPQGSFIEQWDIEGLETEIFKIYGQNFHIAEFVQKNDVTENDVLKEISAKVEEFFTEKSEQISPELMLLAQKKFLMLTIDHLWKDHLHSLDHLRQGISLRAYGQKDPLNEYKKEAFNLFSNMLDAIKETFITRLSHITLVSDDDYQIHSEPKHFREHKENAENILSPSPAPKITIRNHVDPEDRDKNNPETWGKVSRNEKCPCGSDLKFKQCHGKFE